MRGAGRHLLVHLGGALAAILLACALPALLAAALGTHWPYLLLVAALAPVALLVAFVRKVVQWLRAPVPFRIPLTVGQQASLASLPHSKLGAPRSKLDVLLRVLVDALCLRPLLRATPSAPATSRGLGHGAERSLWLAAAAFHGSLAVVLVRHLRFFLEPVPGFVALLERLDLASDAVLPVVHVTTLLLLLALLFLLGRRLVLPRLRHISLAADYFPLLLLLAIATTGFVMRHVVRTDVTAVKQLTLGLANFTLVLPARADLWLVVHVFLVLVLLAYYPLGKLMHMPAVFLSPTLTMANVNRAHHHVNLRNPKVEVLHYSDYEATFRARMLEAGLPVEGAPEGK